MALDKGFKNLRLGYGIGGFKEKEKCDDRDNGKRGDTYDGSSK